MTLEEFLTEMSLIKGQWFIVDGRYLRFENEICCPVTAVCKAKTGRIISACNFLTAARYLDLDEDIATDIANATDASDNYDTLLRIRLQKAVSLL